MRQIIFERDAFLEFTDWALIDRKIQTRIKKIIIECTKSPFEGTGKPEPLKGIFQGYWSRRIDDKNRIVYKVTNEAIIIIACKGHY